MTGPPPPPHPNFRAPCPYHLFSLHRVNPPWCPLVLNFSFFFFFSIGEESIRFVSFLDLHSLRIFPLFNPWDPCILFFHHPSLRWTPLPNPATCWISLFSSTPSQPGPLPYHLVILDFLLWNNLFLMPPPEELHVFQLDIPSFWKAFICPPLRVLFSPIVCISLSLKFSSYLNPSQINYVPPPQYFWWLSPPPLQFSPYVPFVFPAHSK